MRSEPFKIQDQEIPAAYQLAVNPHHPTGPAMKLYRSERIARSKAAKAQKAAASAAVNIAPPVLPPAAGDA